MIIQRGRPLADHHPEWPTSCKWSSVTPVTLVTYARFQIQFRGAFYNNLFFFFLFGSTSPGNQFFAFSFAKKYITDLNYTLCNLVHLFERNLDQQKNLQFAKSSASTKFGNFQIIWMNNNFFSCNKFWINIQCCNFQKLRIKTNLTFCKTSTWPSFSSLPSFSVNCEQFWKTSKLLDFPDCLCLPPLSTMQRTRFTSHP